MARGILLWFRPPLRGFIFLGIIFSGDYALWLHPRLYSSHAYGVSISMLRESRKKIGEFELWFPETLYLCAILVPIKGESRDISKRRLLKRLVFQGSKLRNFENQTRRQGNGRCLRSCIHAASCAPAHEVRLYIYLRGLRRCLSFVWWAMRRPGIWDKWQTNPALFLYMLMQGTLFMY